MKPRIELRDRGQTIFKDLLEVSRARQAVYEGSRWPNPKYRNNPEGFLREVLGVKLIMAHQLEIMNAVIKHDRIAVSSGQKIGKTFIVACLILWYFCSFEDANVTIMMTTKGQMTHVLWGEIRRILDRARKGGVDLLMGAKMAADPGGGLISQDGRKVIGKAVRDIEALGGISGANQLWVIDEASFLEKGIEGAILGNTQGAVAGQTKILMTSNPTRSEGPFFDIFHYHRLDQDPLYGWWTRIYSSREIAEANARAGLSIPGVATIEGCDMLLGLYGANHPFYIVRTLGQFLKNESGKICPLHLIKAAQEQWKIASDWEGALSVGVDPAGKSEGSDAWGFAAVRGNKVLECYDRHGLSIEAGLQEAEALLQRHRSGEEIPRMLSDIDGVKGIEFQVAARNRSESLLGSDRHKGYTYHGVKPSDYARRKRGAYDRVRDELWALLGDFLRDGGAIPSDFGLEAELFAPSWEEVTLSRGGHPFTLLKATPKDILRSPEMLGRSPNKADALSLALWIPIQFLEEESSASPPPPPPPQRQPDIAMMGTLAGGMSPYDLINQVMGRR